MSETPTIAIADDATWQAELERRHRILHMGLQPLVSRFDASGAMPARRALPPKLANDSQSTPAAIPTSVKALLSAVSDQDRAPQGPRKGQVNGTHTKAETTTQPPAPDAVPTSDAAFSVIILRACGWLWVEGLEDGLLRQEQILLTQAMARAISGPDAQMNAHWQQFDWPMVDNTSLARDRETGIHMLRGLLTRMTKEQAVTGTIAMGCHPVVETALQDVQATIPATLDMLVNPAKKADAWRNLRPLRAPRS